MIESMQSIVNGSIVNEELARTLILSFLVIKFISFIAKEMYYYLDDKIGKSSK